MQKHKFCAAIVISCMALPLLSSVVSARPDASVKFAAIREENPAEVKNSLILPYAFSSDSLGTSFGVGGMWKGYGQDQLLIGGTVLASTDEAYIGVIGMWDYQMPVIDRLFFTGVGELGQYPAQRAYVSYARPEGDVYAGSNDSDMDDYFKDSGTDNWFDLKLEYVLSIGAGSDSPIQTYKLKGGVLQPGSATRVGWNPLDSGVTTIMVKQFNRYQSMDLPRGKDNYTVHPLKFALYHNNTDFPANPSKGSTKYLAYTKDFGWGESKNEWDFLEFEYSKYFDLGTNGYTKQQALALNVWTGASLSADYYTDSAGLRQTSDAPPFTQGAILGGLYRMRAFPSYRFNDHAVLYGSAEYRWTPEWNPIGEIKWLQWLKMDWMQLVPFIEVGRVAEDYDLGELFSDMKVDGGISFRAMMSGAVIRFDVAFSDEQTAAWIMSSHPF